MAYTISYPSGTLRKGGAIVPMDSIDPEYAEYVEFLRAGNGPEVLQDEFPPMQRIVVSPWQIRKALNQIGKRETVETAVNASGNLQIQDGWKYSTEFQSDHPLTVAMCAALGMSDAEMHAVFQLAASL